MSVGASDLVARSHRLPEVPSGFGDACRMPDSDLVAQAQQGLADAFDLLVRRHRARAYQVAFRLTDSAADAEDVLQEALMQAWRALPGFRGDAAFATWLHRIVTNRARNRVTRSVRHEPLTGHEPAPDRYGPEHQVEAGAQATALRAAIQTLSGGQRSPLILFALDGMSYDEIAAVLGLSVPTVKSRIHRARRELVEKMRAWR